ncbi:MAG: nucleotidyltransferase family protein [Elusimicrobia bacterium]|nr:nucleotidyltransferase family protein [Elusimicrobiota bacterium]
MKAMILAAGLGTRLHPFTNNTPKALINIGGAAMLEVILKRLAAAGVTEVIINSHHLSEKITGFLTEKKNFGLKIEISRENFFPLETGGGLKKAGWFFGDGKPFFLHNSDVFTEMDLSAMYKAHLETGALATLAVKDRPTSRPLLFDADLNLQGRFNAAENSFEWTACQVENPLRLAFNGVHVISPEIFKLMTETGIFSITGVYLRLAGAGSKIKGFRADEFYWQDIGTPEKLEALRRYVTEKGIKI